LKNKIKNKNLSVGFKAANLRMMSREPMATAHETLSAFTLFSLIKYFTRHTLNSTPS